MLSTNIKTGYKVTHLKSIRKKPNVTDSIFVNKGSILTSGPSMIDITLTLDL